MNDKTKICVVGAGYWGINIIRNIYQLGNLGSVVEINKDLHKNINQIAPNVRIIEDYDLALKDNDIDGIMIATPSIMHGKMVKKALEFKKNVFVVKQNRFNLPIIKLKTAIEKGMFGKIFLATTRVRWRRDQNYYNQAPWRGTYKNDGGVLCNQAIHHIDLLQWLVGGVKSVYAKKNKVSAKIQCEDLAVALMHFKNGALGTIEATTATRPNDLEGSISILGTKGSVLIKGFSANKVENWNFELKKNNNFNYNKFNENPPNVYGFGHQRFYKFVENVLKKKEKNSLNSAEGIKSLKIVTALYKSFEKKREVFMSENLYTTQLGK